MDKVIGHFWEKRLNREIEKKGLLYLTEKSEVVQYPKIYLQNTPRVSLGKILKVIK